MAARNQKLKEFPVPVAVRGSAFDVVVVLVVALSRVEGGCRKQFSGHVVALGTELLDEGRGEFALGF